MYCNHIEPMSLKTNMEKDFEAQRVNLFCHIPAKLRPKPSWVGCIIGSDKTQTQMSRSRHIQYVVVIVETVPFDLDHFQSTGQKD